MLRENGNQGLDMQYKYQREKAALGQRKVSLHGSRAQQLEGAFKRKRRQQYQKWQVSKRKWESKRQPSHAPLYKV